MGDFEEKEKREYYKELKKEKHIISEKRDSYWRRLYDSAKKKMSRGAQNVNKIITWARKDNWRRK